MTPVWGFSSSGPVALLPIDTYTARFDSKVRFGGVVFARSDVEAALRRLLRIRHRLASGDDDDFSIHRPGDSDTGP